MTTFSIITSPDKILKLVEKFGGQILQPPQSVSHFGQYQYQLQVDAEETKKLFLAKQAIMFAFVLEREISSTEEYHLIKILKALVHLRLGLEFKQHQVLNQGSATYIYPLIDDEYFYMDIYQTAILDVDIHKFIGYQLLSSDVRIWKVLESIAVKDVELVEGLALTGLGLPRETLADIESMLDYYRLISFIGLEQTLQSTSKLWLASEICRVWKFRIGDQLELPNFVTVGYFTADSTTGCTFKIWLESAISDIMADHMPLIQITGAWRDYPGEVSVLRDKLEEQAKKSFAQICHFNPALLDEIDRVQVHSDLSITIPILDRSDYQNFIQDLLEPDLAIQGAKLQIMPSLAPILAGKIIYHQGDWLVDFGDSGKRTLAVWTLQEESPLSLEELLARIQKQWIDGKYITKWGRYLYTQHGRISVRITSPERRFHSLDEFLIGMKLSQN